MRNLHTSINLHIRFIQCLHSITIRHRDPEMTPIFFSIHEWRHPLTRACVSIIRLSVEVTPNHKLSLQKFSS